MGNIATQLQTAKERPHKEVKKSTYKEYKYNLLSADNQSLKSYFTFLSRKINPDYESGLKEVPLRSCLLHNKSAGKVGESQQNFSWIIKTQPKWYTDLQKTDFDVNTGEILGYSVYRTDCLTSGNNRKIKAVNRFVNHFKPLYKSRGVSLLFYTLTIANQAKVSVSDCLSAFKKRLKRRRINLQGYLWVLEVSENLHIHYHVLIAIDRINARGSKLPNYLKLDDIWGARCQVEFVKKSVRGYLSKYFVKAKNRVIGKRQFGVKIPKD